MMRRRSGWTLIEVMLVVAIVGVLLAVGMQVWLERSAAPDEAAPEPTAHQARECVSGEAAGEASEGTDACGLEPSPAPENVP